MKFRLTCLLLITGLVAFSCKKSDDPVSNYKSFSGTVNFEFPEFVHYGDEYEVTLSGVSRIGNKRDSVGYRISSSLFNNKLDTLRRDNTREDVAAKCAFKISKDTLGTFSISGDAYAQGYAIVKTTLYFTIVKSGLNTGSLTNVKYPSSSYTFPDERDKKEYVAVDIDGKSWMCQNLSYSGSGHSFDGESVVDEFFGRYYTYEEALNACPKDWHLPTDAEWTTLIKKYGDSPAGALMVDAYFNTERMWEYWPSVKITNESGLSMLPLGYAQIDGDDYSFVGRNVYASFWTADTSGEEEAVARYVYQNNPTVFTGSFNRKNFGANVRCVK